MFKVENTSLLSMAHSRNVKFYTYHHDYNIWLHLAVRVILIILYVRERVARISLLKVTESDTSEL